MRTLKDIIDASGGPESIEAAAGNLSHWAVRKWSANGIPERHWPLVQKLSGASIEELHEANSRARAERRDQAA